VDLRRRDVEVGPGRLLAYGHWGRPLVVFPSQQGNRWDWEETGMVGALGGLIDAGRVKVYCVDSFDSWSWHAHGLELEERARRHGTYEDWILHQVVPWIDEDSGGGPVGIALTGCSFGAYHAANFALKRADLFPLALCMSGVYDVSVVAGGARGDSVYFNNPMDYIAHLHGSPRVAARAGQPGARVRAGAVGGHDGVARVDEAVRRAARLERTPARARPVGARRAARLALVAGADRSSSAPLCLSI
jgi:esterase/lipase superfamily enzyme